ncbi:MAG: hypothetical protein ACTSYM_00475 [Candidatus Baldrarchaeia archaeon]
MSTTNSLVFPESCRNMYVIDYARAHKLSPVSTYATISVTSDIFGGGFPWSAQTRGFAFAIVPSSIYPTSSYIYGNPVYETATYEGLSPDYPSAYLDFDTAVYCDNTGELTPTPSSTNMGVIERGTFQSFTVTLENDFMYTRDIAIDATDWRPICIKNPDNNVLYTESFSISLAPGQSKQLTVYVDPYGIYCAEGLPQSLIGQTRSTIVKYYYYKGFDNTQDVKQTTITYSTTLPPSSERITPDKIYYSTSIFEGDFDQTSIYLTNTLTEPTTLNFISDRWDILCLWDSKTSSWHGSDYAISLGPGEDVSLVAQLDPYGLHINCGQTGVPTSQYGTTQSFELAYIYYGGNLADSTIFDVELVSCTCTQWISGDCYNQTHRIQTRTCNPPGCDIEERYVYDPTCSPASAKIYSVEFFNESQTGRKIGPVNEGESISIHISLFNDGIRDYSFPVEVIVCDDADPITGTCNTNNWASTGYYYVDADANFIGSAWIPFQFSSSALTPTTEPFDVIVAVYNESTKGDISKALDYVVIRNAFYYDGNTYQMYSSSKKAVGTTGSYQFQYTTNPIQYCPNGKAFTYTFSSFNQGCISQLPHIEVSNPLYGLFVAYLDSCDKLFLPMVLYNLSFSGYDSPIVTNVEVYAEEEQSVATTSITQLYCSPEVNNQWIIPSSQELTIESYGQIFTLSFVLNNTWLSDQAVNISLSDYRYMCIKDEVTGTYHNSDYSATFPAGDTVELDVLVNPWGGTMMGCTVPGLPESEIGEAKSETLEVCSQFGCSQATMQISILPGTTHNVYWSPDYTEINMLTVNWALGDASHLINGFGEPVTLTIEISDPRWIAVKDEKTGRWKNTPYQLHLDPLENVSFGLLFAIGEVQMDDAYLTGLPPSEWNQDHIVYIYAHNSSKGINATLELYIHKYTPSGALYISPDYLEFSTAYYQGYSYFFRIWNNDTLGHYFTINVSDNRWMIFTHNATANWLNKSDVVYIPSQTPFDVAITWIPSGGCFQGVCVEGLPKEEANKTHTTHLLVWNDSVSMSANSTIVVSVGPWCICTAWYPGECVGEGVRRYTRSCNPPGCDIEETIYNDSACIGFTPFPNQTAPGGREFLSPSLFEPLINKTLLGEAEELSIFFTPFMILNYFIVGVSGIIGYFTKSGIIFLISMVAIAIMLSLFGYYPWWASITLGAIVSGLILMVKWK